MEVSEVQQLITAGFPEAKVRVTGDGSHFEALVVTEAFAGVSPVQRQKMVYATVNQHITSGVLHALTIKAYTPEQWAKASKFQVGPA